MSGMRYVRSSVISDDDRKLILEVLKNAGNLQNLTKNAAFRPPVRNL